MKHVFNTLKKYTWQILLVILLLFFQANCNLELPNYTSKIVDVGIQQGGIENNVLEVIRESEYNKLMLFLNDDEKNIVNESYTKIEKNDNEYIDKYSVLSNESVYLLNDIDTDSRDSLNDILNYPIIMVELLESKNNNLTALFGENFDVNSFNINDLSSEQLSNFISISKEKIENLESSILEQYAINYVKNEYIAVGIDLEAHQINYIVKTGLIMLGYSILAMLLTISSTYLSTKIATNFSRDLRSKVTSKVMSFSTKEFEDFSTASLITRTTNDIQQVQMLTVMCLRMVIYAPIMGIGAFVKVSGSSMAWVIGLAIAMIFTLVVVMFSLALPKFNLVQKLLDKLNLVSREIITGTPVIRAFGNEKYEEKRFDKANTDLTKTNLFVNRLMSLMMPSMMFIMNAVSILIIWVGSSKVDMGSMQVGSLIAFITYTIEIIMSFLMISIISIMIPRSFVSLKRIGEVLNKEVSIKNKEKTLHFPKETTGTVEFRDVYFRYPDAEEDVLQNISFKATKGTTTAFIGSTGSGKSTLVNLIPRLYDVTGGKILIDGINIKDADLKELRHKIGFVPQKGILFTGTIKSNIAFGKGRITEDELEKAAKISQSLEFINEKEDKFESAISQGGTNVSGGQRQRLSIARAIAMDPEIYIFDDSFSALDYKTDAKLRKELNKYTKNSTILIVAQRISTVMKADQIIVMDNGSIVGIGKHEELMKNCDVYKEIALSQLSEEELANG